MRRARVEDRESLSGMWERSVRATHHFLDDSDIVALRPLVVKSLTSEAVDWWVLVSATGELIGFLGVTSNTIEALFIDPAYHRQGGGKFLVLHAQSLSAGALLQEAWVLGNRAIANGRRRASIPHCAFAAPGIRLAGSQVSLFSQRHQAAKTI